MKWVSIFRKKRCQEDTVSSVDELGELPSPQDSFASSRCKRRSVSVELDGENHVEKRTSLEQWQDARHARNSVDGQGSAPRTTDTLTISKAGDTTIVNNTYIMIKHLGSGTFGKVKLCFNIRDQKLYAVKSCRKSQFTHTMLRQLDRGLRKRAISSTQAMSSTSLACSSRRGFVGTKANALQEAKARLSMHLKTEDIVREIAILKKLQHPNIVSLVEVIDDPRTDSLLLVMEYVEGSTLEPKQMGPQAWVPLPEHEMWVYTREILQGLEYLHFHNVVHGDLKPANLLRDSNSGRIKITDFSSSTVAYSDSFPGTSFSTPAFRPPESLCAGYRASYEMDMWALGVCLYQWAYGELPFAGNNPFTVYENIRSAPLTLPHSPHISAQFQGLLLGLLARSPDARLDVQAAMQHTWVTQGGELTLMSLGGPRSEGGVEGGPMEVTQEELDAAIREGDHVAHLLDDIFVQHHYHQRDHLVELGEVADKIFLLAKGEVEIYQCSSDPDTPSAPIISGLPGENAEDDHVSDFVDVPSSSGGDLMDSTPPPLRSSSSELSLRRSHAEGTRLLAVRGPGESLGLMPLPRNDQSLHVWQASVRAKDEVVAFVAEVSDVLRLLEQHPEMEGLVQQICAQQQTDMMVADAMRQLRLTLPPKSSLNLPSNPCLTLQPKASLDAHNNPCGLTLQSKSSLNVPNNPCLAALQPKGSLNLLPRSRLTLPPKGALKLPTKPCLTLAPKSCAQCQPPANAGAAATPPCIQ